MTSRARKRALVALAAMGLGVGVATLAITAVGDSAAPLPPPAAMLRARTSADVLPSAFRKDIGPFTLAASSSRRTGQSIYLVPSADGKLLCMTTLTASGAQATTCNPASDFFQGRDVVFGVSEYGPPDSPTDVQIVGIVRPEVKRVDVRFPDGDAAVVNVEAEGGFVYSAPRAKLVAGPPTELLAVNGDGAVVDRQSIPHEHG
jgi:hypothetical protein